MTSDATPNEIENHEKLSAASERQTSDWDIRNAPRNYMSLVASQIGSALFSFGAVWLITRYLGSEGYGGIVAIVAASQVAQVFVNWTSVAVVRFGVDEFIETQKIARTFWVRFIVFAANLALVAALSPFWYEPLAGWLKLGPASFWLVMTHFSVTAFWIHVQMSLQAAKLPRVQGFLQMVERLLIFAGLFSLTAAANLTPFWAMICYITAPAAMIFLGIYALRKYVFARFSVDRVFVRTIVAYSLPLLPFSLVGYFSGSYVDAIFVTEFLSTRDLGVYSVATQINGIALQLPTLANSLLLPLFVTLQRETDNQRTFAYFQHIVPTLTLVWGVCCLLAALLSSILIPLFFGMEFWPAALPLSILFMSSAFAAPFLFGYSALTHSLSATYISLIVAVVSAVTNVGLNSLLIPKMGLIGCALATLCSTILSTGIVVIIGGKIGNISASWLPFSLIPIFISTILLTYYESVLIAVVSGVTASGIVAVSFNRSIMQVINLLKVRLGAARP